MTGGRVCPIPVHFFLHRLSEGGRYVEDGPGLRNGAIEVVNSDSRRIDLLRLIDLLCQASWNEALKGASEGALYGILGYCDKPLVSIDFNGSTFSSIVDAQTTHVMENMVKVMSWYDNESGYSNRMVDLAAMIGEQL